MYCSDCDPAGSRAPTPYIVRIFNMHAFCSIAAQNKQELFQIVSCQRLLFHCQRTITAENSQMCRSFARGRMICCGSTEPIGPSGKMRLLTRWRYGSVCGAATDTQSTRARRRRKTDSHCTLVDRTFSISGPLRKTSAVEFGWQFFVCRRLVMFCFLARCFRFSNVSVLNESCLPVSIVVNLCCGF